MTETYGTWRKRRRPMSAPVGGLGALIVSALALSVAVKARAQAAPDGVSAIGPPLTKLSAKIAEPDWLVAFLLRPSQVRPGTAMPDAGLTPAEAQAIARALYEGGRRAPARPQGGDAQRGEALFTARGCIGCHAIEPGAAGISPRVPNLADVGLKLRAEWITAWLAAPRAYHAAAAMPSLGLSEEDIGHLTAFLMTRRAGADRLAAGPRYDTRANAAAGRKLLAAYECRTCHALAGAPPPAPFTLAAADDPDARLRNGRLLVARYNCRGCHRIEGRGGAVGLHLERQTQAPPALDGEGARVQPSWLIRYLQRPVPLRPWLALHMPDYGLSEAEARALAAYFATLDGVELEDEARPAVTPALAQRGLRRLALYKCLQCHTADGRGGAPAGVDTDDLSIDLMISKDRLRPSWLAAFLARPKALAGPATRMPSVFFTADGRPKVDHPDDDIAALAAYVLTMTEPPAAALARRAAGAGEPADAVDWTRYEY